MKISAIDLPSHGFNSRLGLISINPMTYARLIKYSDDYSTNKLTQLKIDIDLLKEDTPGIDELNYYDFESVLLMKKLCSVTSSPKVKIECRCSNPNCNALNFINLNVSEIVYTSFDSEIAANIDTIKLGNKIIKVRVPKLSDVSNLITLLQMTRSEVKFKIFQTLTCLEFGDRPNDVVNAVNTATLDEILLLEHIRNSFIGGSKKVEYTCSSCKRKESVAINIVATDMFRLLQLNEVVDENKITFLKRV